MTLQACNLACRDLLCTNGNILTDIGHRGRVYTKIKESIFRIIQGHQKSSTTYWKRLGACALCFKTSFNFVYTLP